ncbi:MAG TPA: FtsX-like permease family protein, partial [Myxococcaceae bacterium]
MERLRTLVEIALRNLWVHRRRTALLGIALASLSALLVLFAGVLAGARSTILRTATTLAAGHLTVGGFYKVTAGRASPVIIDGPGTMAVVERALGDDLDFVTKRGRGVARLASPSATLQAFIVGMHMEHEPGFRKLLQPRGGSVDDLAKPGTCVLFEQQARLLGVGVGDQLSLYAITTGGVHNTADVRVVAIAEELGLFSRWMVFINGPTMAKLYRVNEGVTGALYVYLKDPDRTLERDEARLRQALADAGFGMRQSEGKPWFLKLESVRREDWTGQQLDISSWRDELSFITWSLDALDALALVLSLLLAGVIAVGVMNGMWNAVRERTREVGSLRAIGMHRIQVVWMFLLEGLWLGLASAAAGAAVAGLTAAALNAAHVPLPAAV